ncbi:DUF2007 domain-containing protein [Geotalea sp. SG265]|uniref:putative signal transducing protein n=1 Tax=Geotalea sp. SG265 TaxID=2922867 RepID=UPI001FAFF33C|nr:DUF2007 domain-containing protein [Geotalea sp. SG265]
MVKFYDPKNEEELARVEKVLKAEGIEYFLSREPVQGIASLQVLVAEEDLPHANDLIKELKK